ncbi:glycosyltransferase family 2 protein [Glaciibacter flavus]|uniref:glycosyltransferase family 2 protein n=1 Tax=Orlajensenia flava TaxID=2565934 RepID=UPI003AFFF859
MDDFRVSVALCTRNGAAFIARQVQSILRQSRPVDEIVVSDDASADDTVAIIERMVAEHGADHPVVPVLIVLRNSSALGVTRNFERAIDSCSGDLIALCDQDDVWHHAKIERLIAQFEERPSTLMIGTDARLVDGRGSPFGDGLLATIGVTESERDSIHAGRGFSTLLRRNVITGATAMIRGGLARRARPFPASWVHDEWLAIVAAASEDGLDLLEEQLLDYRQHGSNEIGATSLTFRGRLHRLRTPRTERNLRLLRRAEALAVRITDFTSIAADVEAARQKQEHEAVRGSLPASRARRIRPVLREWRTGRYSRYGLGAQDVLRDLVQPV